MNFHVIRVHCSSGKYFYMLLQNLSLFNIDFFASRVVASICGHWIFFGVSLWPMVASVSGQFYFISLTETSILFS